MKCAEEPVGLRCPQKNEPQPLGSRGSTPSELRVRGWGGFTRRLTGNDRVEGLFRPCR
jgi:hypothetical protein